MKPGFGTFDQIRHKPGYEDTENDQMVEIAVLVTRENVLSSHRKIKALINLRGSAADLRLCFSHMQTSSCSYDAAHKTTGWWSGQLLALVVKQAQDSGVTGSLIWDAWVTALS